MNSLDNLINFFIVNNLRTCTLARVQTAIVSNYKIQYISLLNVKFVLQKIVATAGGKWPESSGLGNVANFWLTTLPMALPQNIFWLKMT